MYCNHCALGIFGCFLPRKRSKRPSPLHSGLLCHHQRGMAVDLFQDPSGSARPNANDSDGSDLQDVKIFDTVSQPASTAERPGPFQKLRSNSIINSLKAIDGGLIKTRNRSESQAQETWGLHSVPELLSDFRRHTSHSHTHLTGGPSSRSGSPVDSRQDCNASFTTADPEYFHGKTKVHHHEHSHEHDQSHSHSHDDHSHDHSHEHTHDHSHVHSHLSESCQADHAYSTQYEQFGESLELPAENTFIERIPAIISLPTSLLAVDYLSIHVGHMSPLICSTMVGGAFMISSGLVTLLVTRNSVQSINQGEINSTLRLAAGSLLLFWACSIIGSVKATLVMAVLFNAPFLYLAWKPLIPSFIYIALLFLQDPIMSSHSSSLAIVFLAYISLTASAWCLHRSEVTVSSFVSLIVGLILIAPALIVSPLRLDILTLLLIATGSFGVYLLSKRDLLPARYNALVNTILGVFLERSVQLKGELGLREALFDLFLALFSMALPPDADRLTGFSGQQGRGVQQWGIIDSILAHDDTKNIFYFLLLNFSFMLIQLLYSILSHSLGLLSDSIHMFFDCLALLVGLVASILSKLPPSTRFPYGFGKVETVSAFTNGFLLIGISAGVVAEAIERISNPVQLEKTGELLIVSVLGLVVNLVGIVAFNHGHSHGEGSGHSHSHSHSGHNHGHGHSHTHSHGGGDDGEQNENMRGIFLHILADTLGSVGVIISTLLMSYFGWAGFDPLASIFIAIMIFLSAMPLLKSSAKTLLLSLNDNQEYRLRDILNDISIMPGVAGYTVPRFWADGGKIRGVIHIQLQFGMDGAALKSKIENRLKEDSGLANIFIQVEPEGSVCWCNEHKIY